MKYQLAELQTRVTTNVTLSAKSSLEHYMEISDWVFMHTETCILKGTWTSPVWKFIDPGEATMFSLRWKGVE